MFNIVCVLHLHQQQHLSEAITVEITACGRLSHSSWRAWRSSGNVMGLWGLCQTRWSSSFQMCSIGLRSGDFEGQGKTSMFCCWRKAWVILAVCGLALSRWKVMPGPLWLRKFTTSTARILSLYLAAVKVPSRKNRLVLLCEVIPAHTITLPPPNLSLSWTQQSAYLSFCLW